MIIYDPLYGRFEVPAYLDSLVFTPEVRRLSQVRLLNAMSPSTATLGEIRRFSHTLGVLRLSQLSPLDGYTSEERRAFEASVLLHDIGTPPFAHLFEYHLRDREPDGWSHEGVIRAILWGFHAPENLAHQIFAGNVIRFRKLLKNARISVGCVEDIITGRHPLASLLFGVLDLDNLDNVARMAWALGLPSGVNACTRVARALAVDRSSGQVLCAQRHRSDVEDWARLRRQIYDILVFDGPTVAAQAVLSDAIRLLLDGGALSKRDWTLTDEQLIDVLRSVPATKDIISNWYLGTLPHPLFAMQLAGTLEQMGFRDRSEATEAVARILKEHFPRRRVLAYSFVDRGTFGKKVDFVDPDTNESWSIGDTSQSIILYGFLHGRDSAPAERRRQAVEDLLRALKVDATGVLRCDMGTHEQDNANQLSFNFSDSRN